MSLYSFIYGWFAYLKEFRKRKNLEENLNITWLEWGYISNLIPLAGPTLIQILLIIDQEDLIKIQTNNCSIEIRLYKQDIICLLMKLPWKNYIPTFYHARGPFSWGGRGVIHWTPVTQWPVATPSCSVELTFQMPCKYF